jgi:hypothetical protein
VTKFIELFKLLAALLPTIMACVRAVEEALPDSGKGAEKLRAIRELIEAAWNSVQAASIPFAEAWPLIEKAVAAVVGLFNRTGVFAKKA